MKYFLFPFFMTSAKAGLFISTSLLTISAIELSLILIMPLGVDNDDSISVSNQNKVECLRTKKRLLHSPKTSP